LFNKKGEQVQVPSEVEENDKCFTQHKSLFMCLEKNKENMNVCQFALELFEECRVPNMSRD